MTKPSLPQWHMPPVHPVAERLPMMSDAEIDELAADIKAHGLLEPIVLWTDNREEANGVDGPFPQWLLDGRNRLAALERLGVSDPRRAPHGPKTVDTVRVVRAIHQVSSFGSRGMGATGWETEVDPTVYVLSANVRRRHLTSAQKRQAIEAYIAADPRASDRAVARTLGVDNKTVADVRAGPNEEIPQTDHLPIERAKAAWRADPDMTQRQAMAAADVGTSTVIKARKQLEDAGEIAPRTTSAPPARARRAPKANPTHAARSAAPTNLSMRRMQKDLVAFVEDQIGKLDDAVGVSSADIAEYVAAVDRLAARLKGAAERLVSNGSHTEAQSK